MGKTQLCLQIERWYFNSVLVVGCVNVLVGKRYVAAYFDKNPSYILKRILGRSFKIVLNF